MAPLVLFDIDQTLIRTHHAGRASIDAAFESVFGIATATAGVPIDGRTDHAIFTELVAVHRVAAGDHDGARRRLTEAYLARLVPMLEARGAYVLPGVKPLLEGLRRSGIPVGLATGNIQRGARLKLSHFGLWDCFAAGGFGDDTSVRAEVVSEAVRALAGSAGVAPDPGAAIVIGDTPLDVDAAHAAGGRAMAVATGSFTEEALRTSGAEWVLPGLADTEAVLRVLIAPQQDDDDGRVR